MLINIRVLYSIHITIYVWLPYGWFIYARHVCCCVCVCECICVRGKQYAAVPLADPKSAIAFHATRREPHTHTNTTAENMRMHTAQHIQNPTQLVQT